MHHDHHHNHRGDRHGRHRHAHEGFERPDEGARRGHRHGHHGGRGRRGERVFDHGELRTLVLYLIAERPRHGYELIKAIEDSVGGSYAPSPGVIYPTLTLLEEIGHAAVAESDGTRKLYQATDAGREYLAANRAAVDSVLARVADANAARASSDAPQIVRAFENLKLSVRLRTSRGPLTAEQIDAIATVLDDAARAVERA